MLWNSVTCFHPKAIAIVNAHKCYDGLTVIFVLLYNEKLKGLWNSDFWLN